MGILKGIGLSVVGLIAAGAIATALIPKAAPPPQTEAEKKRELEFLQIGSAVKALKTATKDPASFQLDQVLAMADGSGCITYRAKNSFGATVPGQAVFAGGRVLTSERDSTPFSRAHDKHCGEKSGKDITAYARQFL